MVPTWMGGLLSMLVSSFMYGYLLLKIMVMINFENDSISAREALVDFENPEAGNYLGSRNFTEMNVLFYYHMKSTELDTFLNSNPFDVDSFM